MDSFNLGAVLFALLLLLWLVYAIPRTAQRRAEMGQALTARSHRDANPAARDLSRAVRTPRRTPEEISEMASPRPMLRPADPTRRPRFEDEPGTIIETSSEPERRRGALRSGLIALVVLTAGVLTLTGLGMLTAWAIPVVVLVDLIYVAALRRAELQRRAHRHAAARIAAGSYRREAAAEAEQEAGEDTSPVPVTAPATPQPSLERQIETAARTVTRQGEWTPRPVPRPTYAMRGDVDDLATRHAAHRESMLRHTVPLEVESAEIDEALTEDATARTAADLRLDEILERRRA